MNIPIPLIIFIAGVIIALVGLIWAMAGKKVEAVDKKADKALKDAKEAQEEAIVATGLARANRDSLKTLGDQMNKRLDDLFSLVEKALNGRK